MVMRHVQIMKGAMIETRSVRYKKQRTLSITK